jgi:hypothetical protein
MLDKEKIYDKWSKLGLLEGLDNLKILDNAQKNWANRTTTLTQDELEEYWKNQPIQTSSYNPSMSLLPVSMRISSQTLAGGGWQQSKKQKQKQDRLNKLRKLQGDEPNVVLPDDEFVDGLVSVQPLAGPTPHLFYLDFKYTSKPKKFAKKPKKKQIINRADKFKYILKNNNKKWMISRFLKKKL